MTLRIRAVAAALGALLAAVLLAAALAFPAPAYAAVSAVYTADALPSYENPATGAVEDSAGTSNVALGESMVTSIVYDRALIERDTQGTLYVSLRFSLADQISSMSFETSGNGSDYVSASATQMQTGTAGDMQTADYRLAIPSEECTIRCVMDVIPMGRAVTYFITLANAVEGDADGTFVVSVTPGEGTDDESPADTGERSAAAGLASGSDDPAPDTESGENAGVREFNAEGREVTGSNQAADDLDGGTIALIVGVAAAVAVVAGAVAYVAYVRPKRARQAQAAAAAAAAAGAGTSSVGPAAAHPATGAGSQAARGFAGAAGAGAQATPGHPASQSTPGDGEARRG